MGYWITVRSGKRRQGFEASTPSKVIAKIEAFRLQGYEVVRIVDADGNETTEHHLRLALAAIQVQTV